MPLIDEGEIIRACLAGDVESFGSIVQEYQNSLLRTAYRFLSSWEDAKDAVQEALIKAYRSLGTFQRDRQFSTWLYRILVNECLDRLKSARHRHRSQLNPSIQDIEIPSPLDRLVEKELLQKALDRLSVKKRRVLILVGLEGFSGPEAAEIIGCSESTVRVTVMKARQQLRKIYIELNES